MRIILPTILHNTHQFEHYHYNQKSYMITSLWVNISHCKTFIWPSKCNIHQCKASNKASHNTTIVNHQCYWHTCLDICIVVSISFVFFMTFAITFTGHLTLTAYQIYAPFTYFRKICPIGHPNVESGIPNPSPFFWWQHDWLSIERLAPMMCSQGSSLGMLEQRIECRWDWLQRFQALSEQ